MPMPNCKDLSHLVLGAHLWMQRALNRVYTRSSVSLSLRIRGRTSVPTRITRSLSCGVSSLRSSKLVRLSQLKQSNSSRNFHSTSFNMVEAQKISTTSRLSALRSLLASPEYAVDLFVVPSEDQHASEYLAGCDERRAFISGFTGSAGEWLLHHKGLSATITSWLLDGGVTDYRI